MLRHAWRLEHQREGDRTRPAGVMGALIQGTLPSLLALLALPSLLPQLQRSAVRPRQTRCSCEGTIRSWARLIVCSLSSAALAPAASNNTQLCRGYQPRVARPARTADCNSNGPDRTPHHGCRLGLALSPLRSVPTAPSPSPRVGLAHASGESWALLDGLVHQEQALCDACRSCHQHTARPNRHADCDQQGAQQGAPRRA